MRNDFGTRPYKSRFGGKAAMKKGGKAKKQKLIKIRDTVQQNNKIGVTNLKDHQKTLNKWWKDRYLPGETTVMGRKGLKKDIKRGEMYLKKRINENQAIMKTLDDKIKTMKRYGGVITVKNVDGGLL